MAEVGRRRFLTAGALTTAALAAPAVPAVAGERSGAPFRPPGGPRFRVISDNDYSGDPDGLVQLAHLLLSPSVQVRAVIGSHLAPNDPFDPSTTQADNAKRTADELIRLMRQTGRVRTVAGSNVGLADRSTPRESAGARAIVAEAMRTDTSLRLFVTFGAGLTELASAYLMEPRIADRLTAVWIGGPEHEGLAVPPPGASAIEYNLNIDLLAAQVVVNDSPIPIWQVPRDAYRQCLASMTELLTKVRPRGRVGRHLYERIVDVHELAASAGLNIGETYVLGDNPLVLLTALQSSFEADPSSSAYVTMDAPRIEDDGGYSPRTGGRTMRVYTRLDVRLMLDDLYAKLAVAYG